MREQRIGMIGAARARDEAPRTKGYEGPSLREIHKRELMVRDNITHVVRTLYNVAGILATDADLGIGARGFTTPSKGAEDAESGGLLRELYRLQDACMTELHLAQQLVDALQVAVSGERVAILGEQMPTPEIPEWDTDPPF